MAVLAAFDVAGAALDEGGDAFLGVFGGHDAAECGLKRCNGGLLGGGDGVVR